MITIPYQPELVLGSVVPANVLGHHLAAEAATRQMRFAEDGLRDLGESVDSLSAVARDLTTLGLDAGPVLDILRPLEEKRRGRSRGVALASDRVSLTEGTVIEPNEEMPESPVDFSRSVTRDLPLGIDSLRFDVQCLNRVTGESDRSERVRLFVEQITQPLGMSVRDALTERALVALQGLDRDTRIMVAALACTYRDARVLAPLEVDEGKARAAWEHLGSATPDSADVSRRPILALVSGMLFGSGFIGILPMPSHGPAHDDLTPQSAREARRLVDRDLVKRSREGRSGLSPSAVNKVRAIIGMPYASSGASTIVSTADIGATEQTTAAAITGGIGGFVSAMDRYLDRDSLVAESLRIPIRAIITTVTPTAASGSTHTS